MRRSVRQPNQPHRQLHILITLKQTVTSHCHSNCNCHCKKSNYRRSFPDPPSQRVPSASDIARRAGVIPFDAKTSMFTSGASTVATSPPPPPPLSARCCPRKTVRLIGRLALSCTDQLRVAGCSGHRSCEDSFTNHVLRTSTTPQHRAAMMILVKHPDHTTSPPGTDLDEIYSVAAKPANTSACRRWRNSL
jgi:hypothetical protein